MNIIYENNFFVPWCHGYIQWFCTYPILKYFSFTIKIIETCEYVCITDLLIRKPIFLALVTFFDDKVSSNFSIALQEIFCFPSSFSII